MILTPPYYQTERGCYKHFIFCVLCHKDGNSVELLLDGSR